MTNRKRKNMIDLFGDVIVHNNWDKNTSRYGVVKGLFDIETNFGYRLVLRRIINDILDGNWDTYYKLLPDVDWDNLSIDELGGSVRLHNQLYHHGIKTIADVRSLTYEETKSMKGFGKSSWEESQNLLEEIAIGSWESK